jgi:hypothetical protein
VTRPGNLPFFWLPRIKHPSTSKKRPVFLEIKGKHPSTSKKRGVLLEVTQMNKYKIYEEGF